MKKRTRHTATESSGTARDNAPVVRLHWPAMERGEVALFNPFAIPESLLPKPEPIADQAQTPQSIQVAQSSQFTSAQLSAATAVELTIKDADEHGRIRAQERKSRIKRITATATALQQQGVGLVVSTSAGSVARIGEQDVRVGDIINGVLRVIEIGPQGIVVEAVSNASTED